MLMSINKQNVYSLIPLLGKQWSGILECNVKVFRTVTASSNIIIGYTNLVL